MAYHDLESDITKKHPFMVQSGYLWTAGDSMFIQFFGVFGSLLCISFLLLTKMGDRALNRVRIYDMVVNFFLFSSLLDIGIQACSLYEPDVSSPAVILLPCLLALLINQVAPWLTPAITSRLALLLWLTECLVFLIFIGILESICLVGVLIVIAGLSLRLPSYLVKRGYFNFLHDLGAAIKIVSSTLHMIKPLSTWGILFTLYNNGTNCLTLRNE